MSEQPLAEGDRVRTTLQIGYVRKGSEGTVVRGSRMGSGVVVEVDGVGKVFYHPGEVERVAVDA